MAWLLLAAGLVLAVEGLVLALLPGRLDEIVKFITEMPLETRRLMGIISLGIGVFLVWVAKALGA